MNRFHFLVIFLVLFCCLSNPAISENLNMDPDENELYITALTAYDNDVSISGLCRFKISDDGQINIYTEIDHSLCSGKTESAIIAELKKVFFEETNFILGDLCKKNLEKKRIEKIKLVLKNNKVIPTSLKGNLFLSQVGFNLQKNKALFYFHDGRYARAERGYLVLLIKDNNKWKVERFLLLWLS